MTVFSTYLNQDAHSDVFVSLIYTAHPLETQKSAQL